MNPINVLLSDDHTIVRQGLRLLLEAAEDIQVVGEAENGRQAVAETERLRPDVVLLDRAMPLLNGVEATRQITKAAPSVRVVILSSYSDDQHLQQAMEAGAAGYVMKETAGNDLLRAIREVHRGRAFFSPLISKRLVEQLRGLSARAQTTNTAGLTIRQTEILQLIAEGYATKQIAAVLSLALKTVEKHRQALMDKLGIHKVAPLTRYAVSCGVVEANCPPYWQVPRPFVHQAGIRGSALAGWRQTNTHQNEGMFAMGSPGRNGGLGRLAVDRKAVLIAWNQPSASYSPPVTIKQRKYGQQNRAEGLARKVMGAKSS